MPDTSSTGFAEVQQQLIEGGYFRARIQSLTPFDVVAGGFAWGILNSRHSIDVDFVENAHIREKIKVSEKICTALREMSCPPPLEPHQVQGLDYPKLAVVLTWLLKRVAMARAENEFFVQQHTKKEFRRRFACPLIPLDGKPRELVARAPPRVMLSAKESFSNAVEHVSSVLLEYGVRYIIKDSVLMVQLEAESDGDADAQREVQQLHDHEKKETLMMERLMEQMVQYKERQRISSSNANSIFAATGGSKMKKLHEMYEARHAALQEQLEAEENEKNALEKQRQKLSDLQEKLKAMDNEIAQREEERLSVEQKLSAAKEQIAQQHTELREQIQKIDEVEKALRSDPVRAEQLDQLIALVERREATESETESLRAQWLGQIAAGKAECREIAKQIDELANEGTSEQFTAETTKLEESIAKYTQQLSSSTDESIELRRQVDQYPTRMELQQYERRVEELFDEIGWKFEETRLMYARHNTQAEVYKILASEESIFTNIREAFDQCMALGQKKGSTQRTELLEKMAEILKQIQDSERQQSDMLNGEQQKLVVTRKQYEEQIELQQQYHALTAKFKEKMLEYQRQADLVAQMEMQQHEVSNEA